MRNTSISDLANAHSKDTYRPEVDGIRALAVIAVIINHFNKNILPSGYLGVDIFFVISGFVITSSLAGRSSKGLGDFLTGFYVRRIKRLVPALVLFVVITGILICLFSPTPSVSLKTGLSALFASSNFYLLKDSTDYFAASTELNVFTHTWSLGVEEQFYFLFPLIVWITGFGRSTAKGARNLFVTIGILAVASFFSFVYLYQINQPFAYFLMPTRFWELGAGCLLFLGLSHSDSFLRALKNVPPLAVMAAIIMVLYTPLRFAVSATVAVVILTVILIGSLRSGTIAYRLFAYKPIVYIGQISYSLYLWHWGVLSISRWTVGIYWWTVPFQVALMLIFSMTSYKYVELPLRHSEWLSSRPRAIRYGLSVSVLSALFIALLFPNAKGISLVKENKEMIWSHWDDWSYCDYVKSPDPHDGACMYLANQDYPLRIAVIGDSHVGHLASGLREILPSLPSSIAVALYAGCYPVMDSDCDLTRQAYKWVLGDPGIDVVVLSGYQNLVYQNRLYLTTGDPNAISEDAFAKLAKDLKASVDALTASRKSVLMIVDSHELLLNPELEVIPMTGLLREPGSLDVPRESVIARNQRYYNLLDQIASENPRFTVFYSGSIFCDNDVCKSDINGKPLFQTYDHLTPFGAKILASKYQYILKALLSDH